MPPQRRISLVVEMKMETAAHGELPTKTYTTLRELIIRGRLAPGARLREADLARSFGISRTPVREALVRLQQEGYVVAREGVAKTYLEVAPLSADDVAELWAIIGALEGIAVSRVRELTERDRAALADALQEINADLAAAAARQPRDPDRLFELQTRFHERFVRALAGSRVLALYDRIRPQVERYEWAYGAQGGVDISASTAEHDGVIAQVRAGDGAGAKAAIEAHWKTAAERTSCIIGQLSAPNRATAGHSRPRRSG